MLTASLDNTIADHMDTIRWSDLLFTNTCLSSGIARLSGPIWDRANRVTQVCHLERIVPEARSPNWPYGRFYRAPLSVPLETTLGAPRRGAKTTCERWQDRSVASEDRNPVADNSPYINYIHILQFETLYTEPRTAATIPLAARVRGLSPDPGPQFQGGPSAPSCARLTQPWHCPVAATPDTLQEPGRRIGQRGDATRAPTQVPRPGRAARCRPSASRDWPQCDKSINSFPTGTASPPSPRPPPTRRLLPS